MTQTKPIARYDLGTGAQPLCTYSAVTPTFRRDQLSGSLVGRQRCRIGWGINFAHQGNAIFATWYTYDGNNVPLWLSVLATYNGLGYTVRRTHGRADLQQYNAASRQRRPPEPHHRFRRRQSTHVRLYHHRAGRLAAVSQSKQVTRFPFAPAGGTLCH